MTTTFKKYRPDPTGRRPAGVIATIIVEADTSEELAARTDAVRQAVENSIGARWCFDDLNDVVRS